MSISNSNITTELISDFAAGRLDAEDTQIIQEAIDHDEVIATAVLDARRGLRMKVWLAIPALAAPLRALTGRERQISNDDAFAQQNCCLQPPLRAERRRPGVAAWKLSSRD